MAYEKDPVDTASYVTLEETADSLKFAEHLVRFDRERMLYSILSSDEPSQQIRKFVDISEEEYQKYGSKQR